jgi:hypothetical protein
MDPNINGAEQTWETQLPIIAEKFRKLLKESDGWQLASCEAELKELAASTLHQYGSLFDKKQTASFPFGKPPDERSNKLHDQNFPLLFAGCSVPSWRATYAEGNCQDNAACLCLGYPEKMAFLLRVLKGCAFVLEMEAFFSAAPEWLVKFEADKREILHRFFKNYEYQGQFGAWALAHFLRRKVVCFFPELAWDAANNIYHCLPLSCDESSQEPELQLCTSIPIILLGHKIGDTPAVKDEYYHMNHYSIGGFADVDDYQRLPLLPNIIDVFQNSVPNSTAEKKKKKVHASGHAATNSPSAKPTDSPSSEPMQSPSSEPTQSPSSQSTNSPTSEPADGSPPGSLPGRPTPAAGSPAPEHVNKRKAKEAAIQKEKKQKRLDCFAGFTKRSEIGPTAKEVFEKSSSSVSLAQVSSILKTAELSLKKASLEEGNTVTTRPRFEKSTQLEVVLYQRRTGYGFKRTKQEFPRLALTERTTQEWRQNFEKMFVRYRSEGLNRELALEAAQKEYRDGKQFGRPTLLSPDNHATLLTMLKAIRDSGGKVKPLIVIAIGRAVVIDAGKGKELAENGGPLELGKEWARGILYNSLGWNKRKSTTDRKLTEEETAEAALEQRKLEELIAQYHPDLVFEMDETLAPWCPQDDYTYAEQGTGRVQMQGSGDKRGTTVTLTVTKSNKLLDPQTIWDGLTERSLPHYKFPKGFVTCYAGKTGEKLGKGGKVAGKTNKWQNRKTMREYTSGILAPWISRVRAEAKDLDKYPKKDRALFISDYHWSHEGEWVDPLLEELRCDRGRVAKKGTDLFSVLDLAVNKAYKGHMKDYLCLFCSEQILTQLKAGTRPQNVKLDLRASVIKPLAASWIHGSWQKVKEKESHIVGSGWDAAAKNVKKLLPQQ